jgi:hypothetical protein
MTPTAVPPPADLKNTLEEMRASVAARATRKGLTGLVEKAFLGLLSGLMGLLADFRAGKLAPLVPVAEDAVGGGEAACSEREPGSSGGDEDRRDEPCAGGKELTARQVWACWYELWGGRIPNTGYWIEVPGQSWGFVGLDRETDQWANCVDGAVAPPSPQPSPIKGEGEKAL